MLEISLFRLPMANFIHFSPLVLKMKHTTATHLVTELSSHCLAGVLLLSNMNHPQKSQYYPIPILFYACKHHNALGEVYIYPKANSPQINLFVYSVFYNSNELIHEVIQC